MDLQIFNVSKLPSGNYTVKTNYNTYTVVVDEVKGVGIYLEHGDRNSLIKSYNKPDILIAIRYLFKETTF